MNNRWANSESRLDIRLDYIPPIDCPKCGRKFVVSKKSKTICTFCRHGKIKGADFTKIVLA